MTNLRHLHYFRVVAEELNSNRVAERLYIAPSAVSNAIKILKYSNYELFVIAVSVSFHPKINEGINQFAFINA